MAHGRPASRHGRYEAFRTGLASDNTADELPSQSVFSYDGTEDVRRTRENPVIRRQQSAHRRAIAQGVVPSGPVVAVHMFDVPTDRYGKMSPSDEQIPIRPHSQESEQSYGPVSPHPPPTHPPPSPRPRLSRESSAKRRSFREKRPSSSRRSSRDFTDSQEDVLPPMAALRPQSSLGKYHVLPDIGAALDVNSIVTTSRSDGSSTDDRGTEEVEDSLVSQLLHKASIKDHNEALVQHRRNSDKTLSQNSSPTNKTRNTVRSQKPDTSSPRSVSSAGSVDLPTVSRKSSARKSSAGSNSSTPGVLERSRTSISQYKMDEAPQPTSDGQILLGIKIPTDGTRHKQYFSIRDQLRCIVLFAEEVSGEDFSNHILVSATERKTFSNLSQTIEEAGIENKSVIHLEEVD